MTDPADPLSVRVTCRRVVELATQVQIDSTGVEQLATTIAAGDLTVPEWEHNLHWSGTPEQTANYVLVLDALNFCFWGQPRWVVTYGEQRLNGYWALAASLTAALNRDVPLYDAHFLRQIDPPQLAAILDGENEIPLLVERAANLREAGNVLLEHYDGQFANLLATTAGSAARLIQRVVAELSSFNDVASYAGETVRFHKRAQILVSDLHGAFGASGEGLGAFTDLEVLTAFADYKVPQVLRALGVLRYDPALASLVDRQIEIPSGSPEEVEIRAATVWAVELLRRALAERGRYLNAFEIDWALWQFGQALPQGTEPYHRTRTTFY